MNAEQINPTHQETIIPAEEPTLTDVQAPDQELPPATTAIPTPETDGIPEPAEDPIDQALVAECTQMFNAAMSSRFFMSNPNRIKSLKDALNIPISDDKSFQLFFHHADNDLEIAANKIARKNRTVPPEVTVADIVAEAQKRYRAKHGKDAIVNEEYVA